MTFDVVTGGAGFIGSHLVRRLLQEGRRVRVIDDLSTGSRQRLEWAESAAPAGVELEFCEADIRQAVRMESLLEGAERVFHQAAMVSVQHSVEDPLLCHEVNVTGTLNVLEAARRSGVKKVVFASTCAVYGDSEELPKRESMTPEPRSPYAASKLMDEQYARLYSELYDLPVIGLRYFNVFGPGQNPSSDYAAVIPKFITRMLDGKPPIIYGDGEQTRDFVFVKNVVDANLKAAEAEADAGGEILNIGSGVRYSLNELVSILNEVFSSDFQPVYEAARAGDVRHSLAAVEKAEAEIGFRTEVDFKEGLERTAGEMRGTRD